MDPQATSSETKPETTSAAPETPAASTEGAPTEAAKATGPNLKGLPSIKRAELIGSIGETPPGGRSDGGGDRGDRGDRPFRGPKRDTAQDRSGQVKADDMSGTLRSITDEGVTTDAELNAEIEAMMVATNQESAERKPAKSAGGGNAGGGPRSSGIRGPRVVQSGREHRTGTVVSVGPNDVFLEFGPKELGVVSRMQYTEEDLPTVGAKLEVVVDRFDTAESLFVCSKPGSVQKAAWELLEAGQTIEARVTAVNKGGLELDVAGHKAFMPAGQVSLDHIADLSVFIGEKFTCTVTRVDRRGSGNIVLSRRDLLKAEREAKAIKLVETLSEGMSMEGTVRKIMPFGAFVDIGGLDGLLHISDMSHDRVFASEKNVQRFVKEGDKIQVQIVKLDLENKRISLGMKQLQDDPFVTKVSEMVEGAEVMGKVVRLAEFGAFIELAPGVDGLVHISEISRKRIATPGEVLKLDQIVQAKILKVDRDTRKISLSIKALTPDVPPAPGSREAMMADKRASKDKASAERLAEIQKETPELRRKREAYRNKELSGGFGKKFDDGGGLAGLLTKFSNK